MSQDIKLSLVHFITVLFEVSIMLKFYYKTYLSYSSFNFYDPKKLLKVTLNNDFFFLGSSLYCFRQRSFYVKELTLVTEN